MNSNKDTIALLIDSLQQHPIIKGVIPAFAGVGMSFIDQLEVWFRLSGLFIGVLLGLVTLVVKVREAISQHYRLKKEKGK